MESLGIAQQSLQAFRALCEIEEQIRKGEEYFAAQEKALRKISSQMRYGDVSKLERLALLAEARKIVETTRNFTANQPTVFTTDREGQTYTFAEFTDHLANVILQVQKGPLYSNPSKFVIDQACLLFPEIDETDLVNHFREVAAALSKRGDKRDRDEDSCSSADVYPDLPQTTNSRSTEAGEWFAKYFSNMEYLPDNDICQYIADHFNVSVDAVKRRFYRLKRGKRRRSD